MATSNKNTASDVFGASSLNKESRILPANTKTTNADSDENIKALPQLEIREKDAYSTLINDEGWNYNTLSNLNLVTYKLKLFQVEDRNIQYTQFPTYQEMFQTIMSLKQVVILQTGVTSNNIISFTMDSVPAINAHSRSFKQTTMEMVVHEPGGGNLLENMRRSAEYLGIRDPKNCAYYLSLSFEGTTEYGDIESNPCKEFGNGGIWLYQVKILDINQNIASEGSVYTITLIPWAEQLLLENNCCLPAPLAVEAATVGELYKNLANAMNAADEDLNGYNLKTFQFILPKFKMNDIPYDVEEWKITSITEEDYNTKRHVSMQKKDGKIKAQFPKGMSIKDITDIVMMNCEIALQLGKGVSSPKEIKSEDNKARSCLVFSTNVVANSPDYDLVTNNYVMHYQIIIEPFFTQRPILTSEQIKQSESIETQTNNIKLLRKAGYLAKRFDYMLTGKNTEVISLETDFKFSWCALLPSSMGFNNSYESETTHAKYKAKEVQDIKQHQQKLKEVRVQLSELDKIKEEEQKVLSTTATTDAEKSSRDSRLKEIAAKKAEYNEAELTATKEQSKTAIKESKTALAKENRIQEDTIKSLPDLTYAEEISSDKINNFFLPLSVQQDTSDQARFMNSGVFPDYYHRDRTLVGAVMDQLYHGNSGGNMQTVTMEIKGDPFWIGPGDVLKGWQDVNKQSIRDILSNSMPVDCMDFTRGDTYCLIRFRYPVGYADDANNVGADNNEVSYRENQTFTGVYNITHVSNKFNEGQFTQTLTCNRMPLIQIFKSFGYVDEEEEKKKQEVRENIKFLDSIKDIQARSPYWKS